MVRICYFFVDRYKLLMKIGLFYGLSICYIEMIVEKICVILGEELVDIYNVKELFFILMSDYDFLLLGILIWDFGEI